MTTYIRKPTVVQALQYDRQPKKDWPQWLQDYEVSTPMGLQGVGVGAGVLLVPAKNGPTINVTVGEWLVLENGVLLVFKDDVFQAAFRPEVQQTPEAPAAEPASAGETPPAVNVEAPAETPAAPEAPAADAKAGKKKPAGDKPAEDVPAAE